MSGRIYPYKLVKLRELGHLENIKGMNKIVEKVVKDTHFFFNKELGQHLSIIQLVTFLE